MINVCKYLELDQIKPPIEQPNFKLLKKLQLLKKIPKPKVISIIPFDFCNQRCIMCNIWKSKKKDDYLVNMDKIKDFLFSVKNYFGTQDIVISFTGGDIFQDDIIFDLLETSSSLGFFTHIDTNGILLNKEKIKKSRNMGIKSASLSLDGINEETHVKIRGVKGSYNKTINSIKLLFKNGFNITVNTVIMEQNIDEIVSLVKYVQNSEEISCINLQAVVDPKFNREFLQNAEYFKHLLPKNMNRVKEVLDEVITLKKKELQSEVVKSVGQVSNTFEQLENFKDYFEHPYKFIKKECDVLFNMIALNSDMQLHICSFIKFIDLKNRNIKDVWNSLEVRYRHMLMKTCRQNCNLIVNCYRD